MDTETNNLIFLSELLLPGGRQEVFLDEAKNKECIQKYYKENKKIISILVCNKTQKQFNNFATECEIVDFFEEESRVSVVLESINKVKVKSIKAKSYIKENIFKKDQEINSELACISEELLKIFEENPKISSLYTEINFKDLNWVALRWLELLPINYFDIQKILSTKDACKIGKIIKNLLYIN